MASEAQKPNVIVFGGCGFVGRNFVEYLIENDLVNLVRVVDKVPPQVAWLNKKHRNVFNDSRVEFKSCNLINPESCDAGFEGVKIDYAVNFACETKPGQTEPIYKEGIYKVGMNCANSSAQHGVQRYIEISSGAVASCQKVPHKEEDKTDPWTQVAKFKLMVEDSLKSVQGLHYTIVRPAIVYGLGDKSGITERLVIGGVYRQLGESMKLLWDKGLMMNTVHVRDLARAIWHLFTLNGAPSGEIYNLADDSCTTQGKLSERVSELFNINHDYWGNTLSSVCKCDMSGLVEEINDKHMGPWAEACLLDNVENTPLSPYIHQELLYDKHLYLDNSKIKATGFTLEVPFLTANGLREILEDYIDMNLFPKSLLS